MYKPNHEENKAKMKLMVDELLAGLPKEWSLTQMIEKLASLEFHCLENGKANDGLREQYKTIRLNTYDLKEQGLLTDKIENAQNLQIDEIDKRRDELLVDTYATQVAMSILSKNISNRCIGSKVQYDLLQIYIN